MFFLHLICARTKAAFDFQFGSYSSRLSCLSRHSTPAHTQWEPEINWNWRNRPRFDYELPTPQNGHTVAQITKEEGGCRTDTWIVSPVVCPSCHCPCFQTRILLFLNLTNHPSVRPSGNTPRKASSLEKRCAAFATVFSSQRVSRSSLSQPFCQGSNRVGQNCLRTSFSSSF